MKKGHVQIHSENILPIIKKWLYSEKDIFIRELVSNACDAISKRQILQNRGECTTTVEPKIEIFLDKAAKTLSFSDNGIGMNADETEKYLAQIAFSGAEEFIKSYQLNDPFIGHFGLGFYSAFMVADRVDVQSLSCLPSQEPVLWTSDGTAEYEIQAGGKKEAGTEIILHINPEHDEFLDESHIMKTLRRYCSFLPYPIFFNGSQINPQEPLWQKKPGDCTHQDYIDFYKKLYPFEEEPLFWIHLNVDYPFHLKGILYFPHLRRDFDINKSTINLYSNRVFVSDNCKDILPEYLTVLKGAIDSPDIPLNVSRSYLQVDKTVRQLGIHVAKKVADALSLLYKQEHERFLKCWQDCELIVKLGLLQDDKFYERAKEFLIWKNTKGTWTTIEDYLQNNKEKSSNTIFYVADEQHAKPLLQMYESKGLEVLIGGSPLDTAVMSHIERHMPGVRFKRIDAEIDESLLDKSKEKTLLDAEGKTVSTLMAEFVKESVESPNLKVEAKSLQSSEIPGFLSIQENDRRMREYMARMANDNSYESAIQRTFVLNTNSTLVNIIYQLKQKDPKLAKSMMQHVYDLSLLSQKEMDPTTFQTFLTRSNELLQKMAQSLLDKS